MTTEMTTSWAMLMALGAFHGINPGMGWLFAVALGMQERRRGAVLRALVPLGAGHALAVSGAVGAALAIGSVIPPVWLRWPTFSSRSASFDSFVTGTRAGLACA